ncbi:glycoside hydrolase family 125 protein [Lachnospiraceae bacterium 54-11]
MGPYIWERKYEVDSLAFPLFLLEEYYKRKKDDVVTDRVKEAIRTVIRVWKSERNHKNSNYRFERDSGLPTETLSNEGKGQVFTRPWFAWADSMFCLLAAEVYGL